MGMTSRDPRCLVGDDDLAALATGTLTGRDRSAVLEHLEGCPACAAELEELSVTVDALMELVPDATPPDGFADRTVALMRAEPSSTVRRSPRFVHSGRRIVAVAAARRRAGSRDRRGGPGDVRRWRHRPGRPYGRPRVDVRGRGVRRAVVRSAGMVGHDRRRLDRLGKGDVPRDADRRQPPGRRSLPDVVRVRLVDRSSAGDSEHSPFGRSGRTGWFGHRVGQTDHLTPDRPLSRRSRQAMARAPVES